MKFLIFFYCIIFVLLSCTSTKYNFSENNKSALEIQFADSLSNELCKIYGLDQGVRHLPDFERKTETIHLVDSVNFNKIITFIKNNGYPSAKKLGDNYKKFECVELSATSILLHNPKRIIENKDNFNLLVTEFKKGNLSERNLLNFFDKYYWLRKDSLGNRKLVYGSDFGKPCLKYKEISDKIRIEIGLKPLNDSLFNKNCN